jgi:hypothetical protein
MDETDGLGGIEDLSGPGTTEGRFDIRSGPPSAAEAGGHPDPVCRGGTLTMSLPGTPALDRVPGQGSRPQAGSVLGR